MRITSLETLKNKPDDAAACQIVGEFLCFSKADWKQGIPMLSRGNDPILANVAGREVSMPQTPAGQNEVAGAWWEIAEKRAGFVREAIRAHAAGLYARAVGGLTGLAQTLARKRIAEAPAAPKGPIDLLQLIDLKRDTLQGNWTLEEGALKSDGTAKLSIPYQPPAEYDFTIEFTRISGRDQVWQTCPASNSQIGWSMGSWAKIMRLTAGSRTLASSEDPACTDNGVKFTSVIKVRRDHVSVLLNGRQVAESNGPFDAQAAPADIAVPNLKALGIGSWYATATVFSKIEIVPISGAGHLLVGPEK